MAGENMRFHMLRRLSGCKRIPNNDHLREHANVDSQIMEIGVIGFCISADYGKSRKSSEFELWLPENVRLNATFGILFDYEVIKSHTAVEWPS
ncbi:hypothetical protein RB195_002201 [Necator americanus]|uniref:Uncharacterized protein n=1 Tax=Necator americanus TaxID=51031 RepID=A0ABR1DHW1_NECAM